MQSFQEEDYTKRFDASLWIKLLKIAKPFHKNLWCIVLMMAMSAMIDVALPMMNAYAIDHFIANHVSDGLVLFSAIYVLLLGIQEMGVIGRRTVLMQIIATAIGFAAAMVLAHLDYERLGSWWKFYVPVAVVLMLLTFTSLGQTRTDSIETNRSWLNLGFTTIQPAEFLKIAFILSLAYHLTKVGPAMNESRSLLKIAAHAIFPVLLILLQKDWGVALVMLFIVVIMLIMAGLSRRWILLGVAGAAAFAPLAWFFLLDDYQKIRFELLKDPEAYALGQAFQQLQGRISFGSGQLFGIGIFSPDHRYVPDMYNDMIFTFIGESVGFLGALAVLLVYGLMLGRMLRIGLRCSNRMGRSICVGVFSMFAAQIMINVAMCLMVGPSVGVTLPLLSAGGSSVLSAYLGLGLVLAVRHSEKTTMFS